MLPSIVLIRKGVTEHTITGMDEFGGVEDPSISTIEAVLFNAGMITEIKHGVENTKPKSQLGGDWYD